MYVVVSIDRSSRALLVTCTRRLLKVDKNVLYNIQEFQTWSNDLKRRGPAGLRDLPCFPLTCLSHLSSVAEMVRNISKSDLWWKRVGKNTLVPCFLCCRLQISQMPTQERALVQTPECM